MRTHKDVLQFRGEHTIPAAGSGNGPLGLVKADTSSSGSPTMKGVSGGGLALTLASTSEVENLCLYQGDVLPYDIDDLIRVEFVCKISASLDSSVQAAWGVASARNDAIDSITEAALFRVVGDNNVVVETDDGTNNNDDKSTGETLAASYKRFAIDFATGIKTQSPPSLSLGGKGDVRFYMDNANGQLRRVASGTAFDMSNYAGNLQLFAQLQKTAGTEVPVLTIGEICVEYKLPA